MISSVLILGAGGHTKVLLDSLLQDKMVNVLGLLEADKSLHGKSLFGVPVLGDEENTLKQHMTREIKLVNGIGSIHLPHKREAIFKKFKQAGFDFLTVQHSTAYIGREVTLQEGVQVLAK